MELLDDLSPSEREMILIEREKKELEKRAQEAKLLSMKEEATKRGEALITLYKSQDKAQNQEAYKFLKELGDQWVAQIARTPDKCEIYDYPYFKDPETGKTVSEKIILFSEPYERAEVILHRGPFTVKVKEVFKSNRSPYRSTPIPLGYMMYLKGPGLDSSYEGKRLKKASVVNNKVKEVLDRIAWEEESARKLEDTLQRGMIDLQQRYPTAEVKRLKEYDTYTRKESEYIQVTLTNGVVGKFKAHSNGTTYRTSVTLPKIENDVLAILDRVDFNICLG